MPSITTAASHQARPSWVGLSHRHVEPQQLYKQYAHTKYTCSTLLEATRDILTLQLAPLTEKVLIITADSRTLLGNLLSYDQMTNIVRSRLTPFISSPPLNVSKTPANSFVTLQVLGQATERVIRTQDDDEPSEEVPLGLYLVRGDNVCLVGLVDEQLDESIDWTKVKGAAVGTTKHS